MPQEQSTNVKGFLAEQVCQAHKRGFIMFASADPLWHTQVKHNVQLFD